MKRGKDDEKEMGPMFPRLHVNDTEKGGPRAPPRNKMALYEQLSIPSQRFNGGILPPPSSSQGGMNERQQEQNKKQDEDDLRVPIFLQQSRTRPSPSRALLGHLTNVQNPNEKENSQNFGKLASNQSSRDTIKVPLKETNESLSFAHKNASNSSSKLQNNGNLRGYGVDFQKVNIKDSEVLRCSDDPMNGDDVSETSMVDSVCGVDISPDDVVGIIGQSHFWKARRAIVNQQRVFADQVFELHRLIKVQRLIAGSHQLLVVDNEYTKKPSKISSIKKIPVEYILKSNPKSKDDRNTEFSAENAVGKASICSVQNESQTTNCNPFSGNPLMISDPNMGSWSFNQPAGHQWLIPVMSPFEGLVYKPYPGPGFMSSGCGSTPMIANGHNFVNYGVPPPHHQWIGVHPSVPPASHGYFPPFGMPMMNTSHVVEPLNPFNQSSSNVPREKNRPPDSNTVQVKEHEVQVSTASSRSERTQQRNALSLFPTSPPLETGPQPSGTEAGPTRVIRVVPRNARLATESVARIFQSIQEERKQLDSV